MSQSEPNRIFVSYAHRDGADLARRLQADLTANGFDAWLDTQRLEAPAVWSTEIEREIDAREVTVALLTPGSYESEICRAEQHRCLRKGRRLIPVLAVAGANRPRHLEERLFRDFRDSVRYDERLQELFADIRGGDTAMLLEAYRTTRVTYLKAPPRVANYLERPEALRMLRNTLFAEDNCQPIALTAISGVEGVGKTALARALTGDEVVQQAFPDGIVWITAGKESRRDFIRQMREVAKALGSDPSRYEDVQACENRYRATLAGKAALIVVDDVLSNADIEPLLAESRRSRFLITTRDAAAGTSVGARQYSVNLLNVVESRDLLAAWAGLEAGQLPREADEIIAECGRLPLALSMVGARLRGGDPAVWPDTLELLRKVDLSANHEQVPAEQQRFFKAVEVSFQALAPQMQERYRALAVLLEDMSAPLPVLQALWNATEPDARCISQHLVDRSLVQRDGAGEGIRLHGLQLDYIRAKYADREALQLIHGAIRLSADVIESDPAQFASQVVGRLLPHHDFASVAQFTSEVSEGAPVAWLRSLWPTLQPPGTSLIRTLKGHSDDVRGAALSGDGRRAVSASTDETLKVWDVESGRELRTLEGHTDIVYSVALSGDGRFAVSASGDETLKVWDVESARELRTLEGHFAAVTAVAVSEDGRLAVSASSDHTLKVWDIESGRELHTLEGHASVVRGVALRANGQRAVSASEDRTLKVWDIESGRELRTLHGHSDIVYGVAMSLDGRRAISASRDKMLKVWDVEGGRELRIVEGHSRAVTAVAVSGDGRRVVSASEDQTLKVWDVESGRELRSLKGHSEAVTAVAVSEDGRRAVSASLDNTLKVWDVESGSELRTLKGHSDYVVGVSLSGDGRRAVSASGDETLRLWDVESGHELRTLANHSPYIYGVAVSGDGRRAVSASGDETLKVWDVEGGRALRTMEGHSGWVYAVALSGDGQRAVSASRDKTLKVWDVASGRELRTMEGESDYVGVAVSVDGRRAASASLDQTLKVWEVESGALLATFTCDAAAWCCAFVNDYELTAGDVDGRVYLLRLEEPKAKV